MPASIWIDYPLNGDTVPPTFTARGGFDSGTAILGPVIVIRATLAKAGGAAIPVVVATTFCPTAPPPGGGVGTDTQWQAPFTGVPPGGGYSLTVTITVDGGAPQSDATNNITVDAQAIAQRAKCVIVQGNALLAAAPGLVPMGVADGAKAVAAAPAAPCGCARASVGPFELDEPFPIELYPKVASVAGITYELNSPFVLANFTGYFNIGRAILLGTYPACKRYRARLWLLDSEGNILWMAPERALQKLPC